MSKQASDKLFSKRPASAADLKSRYWQETMEVKLVFVLEVLWCYPNTFVDEIRELR